MSSSPDKAVRVVVCGFGRAGRIHTENILHHSYAELVAIIEIPSVHAVAAQYLESHLGVKEPKKLLYTPEQLSSLMNGGNVDALIVTTPTPDHEPFVKAGLLAAKAIFCEKPLASTLQETAEMYKLAEKQGCPLFCSMNRRFDPTLIDLRNTLKTGVLGKPLVLKTVARDHPIPSAKFLKTSGGMVHDCGIHDLDLVCWLAGGLPDEVFTMGFCHDPEIASLGDVDTLAISMKFSKPSTFMATLDLSRHGSYGYDQRVEVFCDRGMLESQPQRQHGLAITASPATNGYYHGTMVAPIKSSFPTRYADSYKAALDHFFKLVRSYQTRKQGSKDAPDTEIIVPGVDVVNATLIADAAERSLKTGKPVRIDYEKLSFN